MKTLIVFIITVISLTNLSVAQNEVKDIRKILEKFKKNHPNMIIEQQSSIAAQGMEMINDSRIYIKGEKKRIDSKMEISGMPGPMETKMIINGDDIWMYSPMRGLEKMTADNPMVGMAKRDYSYLPADAKFIKTETVNETVCHVFKFSESGMDAKVWFNKEKGTLVKSESQTPQGEMVMMVKSYKKLKDGSEVPANMELLLGGTSIGMVVVNSLTENADISDDLFDSKKLAPTE